MKKILCAFSIMTVCAAAFAQTNLPATNAPATNSPAQTNSPATNSRQQEIGLHSDSAYFDGNARQVVYYGHVVATNAQGRLMCERLTIDLPPEGATDNHPTNAVAETNLDIIFINNKGETNHLVADKGIYSYNVVNSITNELFTFTGHATNTGPQGLFTGEPLIWNQVENRFVGSNVEMHLKMRSSGTNSSLFKF